LGDQAELGLTMFRMKPGSRRLRRRGTRISCRAGKLRGAEGERGDAERREAGGAARFPSWASGR
ncbi:MAG: hypothetical protein ACRDOE_06520, partial [Streptosporangiaceae bacterium]